jgi:hypothetical protein
VQQHHRLAARRPVLVKGNVKDIGAYASHVSQDRADRRSVTCHKPRPGSVFRDMPVITKTRALQVIRRAYGSEHADAVADRLPEHLDLSDAAHNRLLYDLGLTPDRLANALGAEI